MAEEEKGGRRACFWCLAVTGLLLTTILVPISLAAVEYNEYGLDQRKTTRSVKTDKVYSSGRYMLGVDHQFIKYPADAQPHNFNELSVFSAGEEGSVGLIVKVDVYLTYLLIKDEIGDLYDQLALKFNEPIIDRAQEAIKNEAANVPFTDYLENRTNVEERFRQAVQRQWQKTPSLHCELDQFHLGRVQIPESVAKVQLQTKIQDEKNAMEDFIQQANLEREKTKVEVNRIDNRRVKVLRTAEADAKLIVSNAQANASRLTAQARINGTRRVFRAAEIFTQDHKSALNYLRSLREHPNITMIVSHLPSEGFTWTQPVEGQ